MRAREQRSAAPLGALAPHGEGADHPRLSWWRCLGGHLWAAVPASALVILDRGFAACALFHGRMGRVTRPAKGESS